MALPPQFMKKAAGKKPAGKMAAPFEKSGKDKEKKGMKEGSKKEMAMDKKQSKFPAFLKK